MNIGTLRADDSRLAHEKWRTWLPLGAVVLALFALVALPLLGALQVRPLYEEIRTVTEPSRDLLTRIHVALALEQSLLRDFVELGDSVAVTRYRRAVSDERAAYAKLSNLVRRLGDQVQSDFRQHLELERAWHADIDGLLARPSTERRARDPLHARAYEELLLSAARLDEGLNAAAARRRAGIEAAIRAQVWITFAIGLVALGAAIIVAWFGKRLRSFAVAEETARQELEEAISSRERLMMGITHDLKNPLQVITASAEMLGEELPGSLNDSQRTIVHRIRNSGRHLVSMVSDLLQLSMAEGGTLSIRPSSVSLTSLIGEVVAGYEKQAGESGLMLTVQLDPDPCEVITDQQRVSQVLQNLISNALKYTSRGGAVSVSVQLRSPPAEAMGPGMYAIDVADTGDGIPPDKLESIFAEFARLEPHRSVPGVGLGLAIARRISLLLGGNITVVSSPRGSTFTFWIPRDRRGAGSLAR